MPRGIAAINAIWRARQEAASRVHEEISHGTRRGYDPNQPRVPAGHSDGGQWTRGGYGWASAERVVVNADGSTVRSEVNATDPSIPWDERHTVRLPSGHEFTYENFGPTQTVYDGGGTPIRQTVQTSDGPEPQAIVEPVFYRRPPPRIQIPRGGLIAESPEALFSVFGALSAQNRPSSTTVLDFRAQHYMREPDAPHRAILVDQLTEVQVRKFCNRYNDTQEFLDKAVDEAHKEPYRNAAIFGTRVHKILHDKIEEKDDEDWKSEISLEKILQEDPRMKDDTLINELRRRNARPDKTHYAKLNSIRLDVLDYDQKTRTACIMDVKTGKAPLTLPRIKEMVRGSILEFPSVERFIIVEMRPSRMRAHR